MQAATPRDRLKRNGCNWPIADQQNLFDCAQTGKTGQFHKQVQETRPMDFAVRPGAAQQPHCWYGKLHQRRMAPKVVIMGGRSFDCIGKVKRRR
jgi:hypothetical protein